ncbi:MULTISPECIES: RrF2 family transcriptional regulator [Fusobacterium]|uniref:RrF2 family transcriptional regulator n=1 Tax=Fusobacterium TaxID=848 RepID=UPI0004848642|nr:MULTISPECIES: Rrf2 family transcriptional regulator [Fusobacterium]MCI6153002.1 Rrf2 family transcriptional regulator [Fusobacterium perfoetens]MDY3237399.1 Rrf2 family transcriptional regulator [Fusobacterium perfoetens]NME35982.1 Rrf2 family transcriptional regulator [Fusobacterium sp. FSA-380-WT-3A]
MKINTKVRYGLKALVYIVEESLKGKMVRIKEISEKEDISIQYLEQILNKLKNENIIEGKRGPNGGYKLLINPNEITLYRIYKILDDDDRIINCNENVKETKECSNDGCNGTCIWNRLDSAMKDILKSTTLEDLVKNKDII